MSKEDPKEDKGSRSFAVLLAGLEEGRLNAEASDELQRLAGELYTLANDVGKAKGTFTIKLTLSAEDNGTIAIMPEVTVKSPKMRHARSLYWVGPGNHLVKEDPKQTKLPMRAIEGGGTARPVGEQQAPRGV